MKWIGTQTIYDHVRLSKGITLDSVSITTIQSSGESFADNDTSLMTSAAIADKIEAYGYSTTAGDITGVTITTDSGGGSAASDTGGSADFSILGSSGVGVTNSGTTITAVAVPAEIDHDSLNNYAANEHFTQASITTVGTIGTGVWQGTAINQTYLNGQSGTNTGDETRSSIEGLGITVVGTIGEGTWQGTAIASAYLDADTAHLSGSQTFTGTKTLNSFKGTGATTVTNILDEDAMGSDSDTALATQQSIKAYADRPAKQLKIYHANFKGNARTTETFIPLAGVPDEHTDGSKEQTAIIMPCAGKVKEIILRMHWTSSISTDDDITWRVYNRAKNLKMNAETIIGSAFTMVNPTQGSNDDNNTRTSGEISYAFAEYDAIAISMQWDNTGPTNSGDRMYVTVVTELDVSGIGY